MKIILRYVAAVLILTFLFTPTYAHTLVMGVVIFYGVLIIVLNFLVDLIYAWLNPKVRYDEKH